MKRLLQKEDGQTLVLTALCASVLLGFMALALDVGVLYHTRRQLQTAADAAALAGALDYLYNQNVSHAQTAACNAADANGFKNATCTSSVTGVCSGTGNTICVNLPPQTGPNAGTPVGSFVEVVVRQPKPLIFRATSMDVAARAVGALPTAGQACIWVMNPSGSGFDVQGKYDIETPNCGIYVNSNTSDAMGVTGNAGTVNAQFIDVVGNSSLQHQTSPTPATMNSGTRKSPWGDVDSPCWDSQSCKTSGETNGCTSTVAGNTINATTVASIGTPASGSVICFTGSKPVISGTVTFPGAASGVTYLFENGVEINTGATVTMGQVVTYNPNTGEFEYSGTPGTQPGAILDVGGGTLKQDSNSLLNIYAPDGGTYNGIAIMQPSWNTSTLQVQFGSNNETLDGYIFAPGGEVYLQDNGGGVTATGIVCNQLYDKASTLDVAHSYDKANPTTTLNRVLTLVE